MIIFHIPILQKVAKDSYDALPENEEANQTAPSHQYEDKVGEGIFSSQSTTEESKGSYYLRPSFLFRLLLILK